MRKLLRRWFPFAVRLRVKSLARAIRDRRGRIRFAEERVQAMPFTHASYTRRFIDYPGQEKHGRAKRQNQRVLAANLDGVAISPGETLSIWHLAERPTASAGYAEAAALKNGELVTDIGGAICLLSTCVFNAALLAGMDVTERWEHSVDSYGDARYFELGRDAAIEYGYRDLRFRNPHPYPVALGVVVTDAEVTAAITAPQAATFAISLEIESTPGTDAAGRYLSIRTVRIWQFEGGTTQRDPPFKSRHRTS